MNFLEILGSNLENNLTECQTSCPTSILYQILHLLYKFLLYKFQQEYTLRRRNVLMDKKIDSEEKT